MTYSQGSTHAQVAEINIIPLADVMLVLLIIFMIATPALTRQIDLTLPGIDPGRETSVEPPPIRLRIDAAGQVFWNDNPTPLSALQAMMAAEATRDTGRMPPRLEIDASGDSDYQAVAGVLAAARNADMVRVAFVRK